VAFNFTVDIELQRLPPFPLGRPDQTVVFVTCHFLIHCDGSGTDALLNGRDRWARKLKHPPAAYTRGR
jgi:hypothetical protein